MSVLLALAQTLTNLMIVPAGSGLPSGWKLNRMQGVDPPTFEVTRSHTLHITAIGQGGTATYRLRNPIRPPPRQGTISWRWRAETPLRDADLKRRAGDDSPIRVVITFQDGRWHEERRDPFSDYRRLWNVAPKPIVSVGVRADTEGLKIRAAAEIGDIT